LIQLHGFEIIGWDRKPSIVLAVRIRQRIPQHMETDGNKWAIEMKSSHDGRRLTIDYDDHD
jgi:hypothetical protein